jgi:hypothetical protein
MFTLNLGIYKEFGVYKEGVKVQFRAELFNAANKTNFIAPNSDRASASFGKIRSTYAQRQVQFALKLVW